MTDPVSHDRCDDRRSPGASRRAAPRRDLESTLVPDATAPPAQFQQAVASLRAVRPRPELLFSALDAPPRLAPYTWAFGLEADAGRPGEDLDEPDTSGRLILLHDPDGQAVWEGTFRLVCFVQARLEPRTARRRIATGCRLVVAHRVTRTTAGASYVALGGTVTQTSSVRFGDIAGPRRDDDVELRASWTPVGHGSDPARRGVLRPGRGGRRTTPGGRPSPRPSELISGLTCVFDARCDQRTPPVEWIDIDIAVTFTHRIPNRYRR